jgi:hypothetical protein
MSFLLRYGLTAPPGARFKRHINTGGLVRKSEDPHPRFFLRRRWPSNGEIVGTVLHGGGRRIAQAFVVTLGGAVGARTFVVTLRDILQFSTEGGSFGAMARTIAASLRWRRTRAGDEFGAARGRTELGGPARATTHMVHVFRGRTAAGRGEDGLVGSSPTLPLMENVMLRVLRDGHGRRGLSMKRQSLRVSTLPQMVREVFSLDYRPVGRAIRPRLLREWRTRVASASRWAWAGVTVFP